MPTRIGSLAWRGEVKSDYSRRVNEIEKEEGLESRGEKLEISSQRQRPWLDGHSRESASGGPPDYW